VRITKKKKKSVAQRGDYFGGKYEFVVASHVSAAID
jgi:hypothetical protein